MKTGFAGAGRWQVRKRWVCPNCGFVRRELVTRLEIPRLRPDIIPLPLRNPTQQVIGAGLVGARACLFWVDPENS